MSLALRITAGGLVDRQGFVGSAGVARRWSELGLDPLVDKLRWKALFTNPFPDFRHLDRLSRVLCIATECAGLPVPGAARDSSGRAYPGEETALVSIGARGCLDSDWHFERSLATSHGIQSRLFPYTLTSTGLGAVAIRHGLRGPTLALSCPPGGEGPGIRTACELVSSGETPSAVLCLGDWVGAEAANALGVDSRAQIVALRIEGGDPDAQRWPPVPELFHVADPVSFLGEHVRARFERG